MFFCFGFSLFNFCKKCIIIYCNQYMGLNQLECSSVDPGWRFVGQQTTGPDRPKKYMGLKSVRCICVAAYARSTYVTVDKLSTWF